MPNDKPIPLPEYATPIDKMSYEEAYAQLEEIVNRLENDEHSLEISISLFERGQALVKYCSGLLEKAELRIRQIVDDQIVPFDTED